MSWDQYFQKNKCRPIRPLLLESLEIARVASANSKMAIDLGCGAGIETAELLRQGWRVLAIDLEEASLNAVMKLVPSELHPKLEYLNQAFEEIQDLPKCDLIFAYHSLPFCQKEHFHFLCELALGSLNPGGIFAGSFFGMNDDWVRTGTTVGVTTAELTTWLGDFRISHIKEFNEIGLTALGVSKNWHYVDVIAVKNS